MSNLGEIVTQIKIKAQEKVLVLENNVIPRYVYYRANFVKPGCLIPDEKAAAFGWQQFRTQWDDENYGVVVNSRSRTMMIHCLGDWTLMECADAKSYRDELCRMTEFYENVLIKEGVNE